MTEEQQQPPEAERLQGLLECYANDLAENAELLRAFKASALISLCVRRRKRPPSGAMERFCIGEHDQQDSLLEIELSVGRGWLDVRVINNSHSCMPPSTARQQGQDVPF